MSKDTGGPAFPIPGFEYLDDRDAENPERVAYLPAPGMTLRDYFAANALAGMLADRRNVERFEQIGKQELIDPPALAAAAAYQMADAMLAERAK